MQVTVRDITKGQAHHVGKFLAHLWGKACFCNKYTWLRRFQHVNELGGF